MIDTSWIRGIASGISSMPAQALPKKQKDEDWQKATMDSLELEGLKQISSNVKYKDLFRMINGKMSYSELSDVIPQLREVEQALDTINIPTYLRHYDILGTIINGLVGEYITARDKFICTNIDEIASNEYERDKRDMLSNYVREALDKEINLRMIAKGINPMSDGSEFKSEEEKQQYLEYIQNMRTQMTPPEIEETMSTKWKTIGAMWGHHTLEADDKRFYMEEMDRDELISFLGTGKCFRGFELGYDYYKPETWSVLNTFHSNEPGIKYPQDGEFIGKVELMTAAQIVNKYGHLLSKKQKDKVLGTKEKKENPLLFGSSGGGGGSMPSLSKQYVVPHSNYFEYNDLLSLQEYTGTPLGVYKYKDKEGNEMTGERFLPQRNSVFGNNVMYSILGNDVEPRADMYQVTLAYWRSFKEVYLITLESDTGLIAQELFTDDILPEVFDEMGLKKLKNISLSEAVDKKEPNTVVFDYAPEIWKGIKISGGYLKEPLYLDVAPMDFQIKGDSNIFDVKLPVAGIISNALGNKIQPYQVAYNVVMNQAYNLLEKEIGMFFIFDINYLPSEVKGWGDTEETLLQLRQITKDTGLFPVDSSKQNLQGGAMFNQFGVQNLTYGEAISQKLNLAQSYKNMAYESIGVSGVRLSAQPVKYSTNEGIKVSNDASYAQTEVYFDEFRGYKKRMLELHLDIAQYAQGSGKDLTVMYTKSDQSQSFLKLRKFNDPDFPLRKLGILPISDSKKRKEMETFKQYILQNNTIGADELSIARIISSDTMQEIITVARQERLHREGLAQQQQQAQEQLQAQQMELQAQYKQEEFEKENYLLDKKLANNLEVKRLDALGRSLDNNATGLEAAEINRAADLALQREKNDAAITAAQEKQVLENKKETNLSEQKLRDFTLEVEKLKLQREKLNNDRYIAQINKN